MDPRDPTTRVRRRPTRTGLLLAAPAVVAVLATAAGTVTLYEAKTTLESTVAAQMEQLDQARRREVVAAAALTQLRVSGASTEASLRSSNDRLTSALGAFAKQAATCEDIRRTLADSSIARQLDHP